MTEPATALITKVDFLLFALEKTVPGLHGLLPLGGDHVAQFGYLSIAICVIEDAKEPCVHVIQEVRNRITGYFATK